MATWQQRLLVLSGRQRLFLKDVLLLSVTAFGGPQAHMALYLERLVAQRNYLTEAELLELHALCQFLPGPTSTQTITAIGYRRGGVWLAFLTLLIWAFPAVSLMTLCGLLVGYYDPGAFSLEVTRFIQPMAIGFVAYAAWKITSKVVNTKAGFVLMLAAAVAAYFYRNPWLLPLIILVGGLTTALKYRRHERQAKTSMRIHWGPLLWFLGIFVLSAVAALATQLLPVRLFENFYRNGALIFGGGQVLVPVLSNEFVAYKQLLSDTEFLSGYGLVQAMPGPVFSFTAYIGVLSMRHDGWGSYLPASGILGGGLAALGIFLPGTLLIFFAIRFWDQLKQYRPVRASLEGINAASSGLVVAAVVLLSEPLVFSGLNISLVLGTLAILLFTKVPAPLLVVGGLAAGFLLP